MPFIKPTMGERIGHPFRVTVLDGKHCRVSSSSQILAKTWEGPGETERANGALVCSQSTVNAHPNRNSQAGLSCPIVNLACQSPILVIDRYEFSADFVTSSVIKVGVPWQTISRTACWLLEKTPTEQKKALKKAIDAIKNASTALKKKDASSQEKVSVARKELLKSDKDAKKDKDLKITIKSALDALSDVETNYGKTKKINF